MSVHVNSTVRIFTIRLHHISKGAYQIWQPTESNSQNLFTPPTRLDVPDISHSNILTLNHGLFAYLSERTSYGTLEKGQPATGVFTAPINCEATQQSAMRLAKRNMALLLCYCA